MKDTVIGLSVVASSGLTLRLSASGDLSWDGEAPAELRARNDAVSPQRRGGPAVALHVWVTQEQEG